MSKFLQNNGPWSQLVDINNIKIEEINFESSTNELSNILVTPVQVPHRDEYSETAGYIIKGKNKKALFIPDIDKWGKWEQNIFQVVMNIDIALIDGTFFSQDELPHSLFSITLLLWGG